MGLNHLQSLICTYSADDLRPLMERVLEENVGSKRSCKEERVLEEKVRRKHS